MSEKVEINPIETPGEEKIGFIPLILFEKYIEITDNGIEYLKSFNNNVIIYIL
jgi:hypothetical protein